MNHRQWNHKLLLLGSLYISQYISLMFFVQALPVFMREQGASLESVGLIYLLALPLLLKVFWSPWIDRYGYTRWGHYRFWIVIFQLLLAAVAAVCAFVSLHTNFMLLFGLLMVMATLAASQDIATDALAVGLLAPTERGWGNGIQMAGNYLGAMLGGGVMLVLLNQWGWRRSLLALSLMVMVALVPILCHQERLPQKQANSQLVPVWMDLVNFYRRPGVWHWLMLLTLYVIGGSMAESMFRPLLVDIGLSLADIGWLLGVVGNGASIVGAVVSGLLVIPLGRKQALLVFGLLQSIAILMYLLPALGAISRPMLYLVTIVASFANSAIFTVSSTVMMDKSRLAIAGTEFTAQTSMVYFGAFGAASISGVIASAIGYQGLFGISAVVALLSVVLISRTLSLD
ncbi:arabinose efflux permease family protein [Leptolyngbya sp. Heron Island J]|uniref:MFS transporter n=1 Tax=Leptolyngbya sp. Heron Island J TaxID=1385935 RepID=UPI0003B9AAB9|nr:MFS transporter [Leptolyngbya sp. Heron Island J]ESA35325.1 arabinose efflux permease family protein [Leptolyngbya sp. Heron Island J]